MNDQTITRIYCSGCGCNVADWDVHEQFHAALEELREKVEVIAKALLRLADK